MAQRIAAIDVWVTPFNEDIARMWRSAPQYLHGPIRLFQRPEMFDVRIEDCLREMDRGGVEKAVLSAINNRYVKLSNEWVAEHVRKYPDRLVGCAAVNPEEGMQAVRELEQAVRELGLKGLKLLPYAHERAPNANIYYPLYAKCVELDIPVHLQVGHTAALFTSEVGRPIYLDEVALHFPELKIIGAHMGWPWTEEMMAVAWKHPNVYFEMSGHYPSHYSDQLIKFMDTWGQDKVMYASSFPLTSIERQMREIYELPISEESRSRFLRDNALKVWKI